MSDIKGFQFDAFSNYHNIVKCSNILDIEFEKRCEYFRNTSECQDKAYFYTYIQILYCLIRPTSNAQQICYIGLLLCLCVILCFIVGITAENFFCPSLEMISKVVGLSEHFAGVTLLAISNGSSDILSSLSSIDDVTATMFSNLLGAGVFVTAFVSCVICFIRPFRLSSGSNHLRDIFFFIFGILFIDYAIETDNCISIFEACCIIIIYISYLVVICLDQFFLKRRIKFLAKLMFKGAMSVTDFKEYESLREQSSLQIIGHKARRGSLDINSTRRSFYGYDVPPNINLIKQFIESLNFIKQHDWSDANWWEKIIICFKVPIKLVLVLFIPKADYIKERHGWYKLLNCIQVIILPFTTFLFIFKFNLWLGLPPCVYTLIISVPLAVLGFIYSRTDRPPKFHVGFAFLAAYGSIFVICSCATQAAQMLFVLSLTLKLSNSYMGCTLLAWGNNIGDLITNSCLAIYGYNEMALSGCYGAPLFNTLLSFGIVWLIKTIKSENGYIKVVRGPLGENCYVFLLLVLCSTLLSSTTTNFQVRRSVGAFCLLMYGIFLLQTTLVEFDLLQSYAEPIDTPFNDRLSFSEPDIPVASIKHLDRFAIKHPHEYTTVDELKFYRRRKPPEWLTKSNICLTDLTKDLVLPRSPFKSEYTRSYHQLKLPLATLSLRRATSLRLEGLMPFNRSEQQDSYLWFTPEDWKSSRSYPMKKPESLRLAGVFDMEPEYRSSYIMYPMVDRATKILPREMFSLKSPSKSNKTESPSLADVEIIQKLNEDKLQRTKAKEQQQECHLQRRAITDESQLNNSSPSEYQRQYVPQLIEKAHSIPQMSHIKMQGNFHTVPEYQDSFKMYANYAKTMPIKKTDNLLMSGSEIQMNSAEKMPEYREKFHDYPQDKGKEKSLKTEDHLRPAGEFSKDIPEYFESFRDPQVGQQMPEKGKCREPYLHLKGKLEFNPEYRNTYLDFPRSRPVVVKPTSTFRLPTSNTTSTTTNPSRNRSTISPQKHEQESTPSLREASTDITTSPEYRKACFNYQLRERSPTQKAIAEAMPKDNRKFHRKSLSPQYHQKSNNTALNRQRRPSVLESQSSSPGPDNAGQKYKHQKTPKFGRRAANSVLKNAENCRANTSIIEGNPKYTMSQRPNANNSENIHDSFVVLENKPKRSHWMN